MNHDELLPDCGRIRNELPGLLYDELAPDLRTAVEQHLATCPACADEWAGVQETRKLLAHWETPPAAEDPRELARRIAVLARTETPRAARRARLLRWSARLSGAAAAVLFLFSLLSARASLADGRMELSFGFSAPRAEPGPPADWREQARSIAAQEFETRSVSLQTDQEALFQRCSVMTRQELLRLSQAVDLALEQNQQHMDTRLASLGREAALADLETRRVVTDLAAATLPVSQKSR